tara:strand:+ start:686 stop:2992 length:2307 start_codon:yes stop_codon:yes gene_type:complete
MSLLKSDDENEVKDILIKNNLWDSDVNWRLYGDRENNYSTIGNQQSNAEAAIVEKIINSVDAVLIKKCKDNDIDPASVDAPKSIVDALEKYFNIDKGKLSNITKSERTELAKNIGFVSSGTRTDPCYSIFDNGEGQHPEDFPKTFLSLNSSNKISIKFVQGKYNMGGSGVLDFCGQEKFQFILSKKNDINYQKNKWGFTLVRRRAKENLKIPIFEYLTIDEKIPSFSKEYMQILPSRYPDPHGEKFYKGSFIKLYNYRLTAPALKTNILFDLNYRLSLLMPELGLPVRLYERRDKPNPWKGKSFESTLAGLNVRLEDDRGNNLEEEFSPPPSAEINIKGNSLKVTLFVFKKDKSENFRTKEGVLFTVNGQTHGGIEKFKFKNKSYGLNFLSKDLLVIIDCSKMDQISKNDLFMPSRDRLRDGELQKEIEKQIQSYLSNHQGLKKLNNERRQELVANKIDENKPLANTIEKILKKSPLLSTLMLPGIRISNPYNTKKQTEITTFSGQEFPSYFDPKKVFTKENPKIANLNQRFKFQYKTDVLNNYITRDKDPGNIVLKCNGERVDNFSLNFWNGTATLNVELPDNTNIGDVLIYSSEVSDIKNYDPFKSDFVVIIDSEKDTNRSSTKSIRKEPHGDKKDGTSDSNTNLSIPEPTLVYKDKWSDHEFNEYSCLRIESHEEGDDIFINMENKFYLIHKNSVSKNDYELVDNKYKTAMVLVALALLWDLKDNKSGKEEEIDRHSFIKHASSSIARVIMPMIDELANLELEIS